MRLYPETGLSTDWLYDRSHRIWTEIILMFTAWQIGFLIGLVTAY